MGRSLILSVALAAAPALVLAVDVPPTGLSDRASGGLILQAEDGKRPADLAPLLADPRPAVRARVALALGRIGLTSALDALAGLLADPVGEVRVQAAFALGSLEYDLGGAVEPELRQRARELLASRVESAGVERAVALWALGRVGGAAELLGAALAAGPGEVLQAELLLDAWWRTPGAGVEPLAPFVAAGEPAIRLAAANALRRLDSPRAMPALEPLLEDPEPEVRAMALRGMGEAPAAVVARHAPRLLADHDRRVQCAAADWVRGHWSGDTEVGDALFEAVLRRSLDRSEMVRGCALAALGAVADRRTVAEDRLLEALAEPEPALRSIAASALVELSDEAGARAWERLAARSEAESGGQRELADEIGWTTLLRLRLAAGQQDDGGLLERAGAGQQDGGREAFELLLERAPARAAALAGARWEAGAGAEALSLVARAHRAGAFAVPPADHERLWRAYWDRRAEPAARGARAAALDLLLAVNPGLIAERVELVATDPDRLLRLQALRAVADELPGGIPTGADALAASPTLDDPEAFAERVLQLQETPPRIEMTTERGVIVVELRPDWAPRTALRILDLIESGVLAENRFHRVIPGFVAQGGAAGSPLSPLPAEDALLDYRAGRLGLALGGRDTGTSQFFLTRAAQPHLVGSYPIFGEVVEGQRVVDRLLPGDTVRIRRVR